MLLIRVYEAEMKKILVLLLVSFPLFAQLKVTFQANMAVQIKKGLFIPASDSLVVRGDFQVATGGAADWSGNSLKLKPDAAGDSIYKVTVTFPAAKSGTQFHYKFVKDDGIWESNDNRIFLLGTRDTSLYPFYFNDDSVFVFRKTVTIKYIFNADTRGGCKLTDSWLNDATDSLLVEGLDWLGNCTILPGSVRKMHLADPKVKGIYTTTIYLTAYANESVQWKFHAYGQSAFSNSGWETISNRNLSIPGVDSTVVLPSISPIIAGIDLPRFYSVVFSIDMNQSPVNAYSKSPIPTSKIGYIAIYGDTYSLGGFMGSWNTSDSARLSSIRFLNDSGLNGDQIPGDHIWTTTIPINNCWLEDTIHYRYSCFYPGADSMNHGIMSLDNEFGGITNHSFCPSGPISKTMYTVNDIWGSPLADVKGSNDDVGNRKTFLLLQNYPNPFNPETKIQFSIPEPMKATLKVFDVLGREVITLIDGELATGIHTAVFNGKSLQSGMYICRLQAGKYTMTKKMLLIK